MIETDALKQSIEEVVGETLSVNKSKEINPGMQAFIIQKLANTKIDFLQFNRLTEICIKGIPQYTNGNHSSRVNDDSSNMQKILSKLGEYDPSNISRFFRLGCYKADAPDPPTLLIGFFNEWMPKNA